MEQVKAALYEIFTVAALVAATVAVVKSVGVQVPVVTATIQDLAMVAVACAAARLAR
jgi:hypothetical protein